MGKKETLDQKVNKPAEQVKLEKLVRKPPKKNRPIPYTFNDAQSKVRRQRNIKARIQKNSRRTNR